MPNMPMNMQQRQQMGHPSFPQRQMPEMAQGRFNIKDGGNRPSMPRKEMESPKMKQMSAMKRMLGTVR